ncbi:proteoglycan 4-like [Musca vetustissima]|uniref:proteoglycan 4-like n=1 Tax=Musca vetustissima TaxID=27455 RepID=UPI002AB68426|nr:proteoglycan 4-like [Musca vetustissima]
MQAPPPPGAGALNAFLTETIEPVTLAVLSAAWAFYGNPDAEIIDTSDGSAPSSFDQFIINAAIRRGMDGDAVAELLRTRQPVVRVKIEPPGIKKTTTYKLDPDGSISSKTLTEIYGGTVPSSLNIPTSNSGTVTRTFTSSNGPRPGGTRDNFDHRSTDNWFGSPTFGSPVSPWSAEPSTTGARKQSKVYTNANGDRRIVETTVDDEFPTNYHHTTKTFRGPNGETRVVKTFSSNPLDVSGLPSAESPSSTGDDEFPSNHRQVTKTYRGPNGETRVVKTYSTNPIEFSGFPSVESPSWTINTHSSEPKLTRTESNFPSKSWPSFDNPFFPSSWLPHEPMGDPDDWTVVEDDDDTTVSTTTSKETIATSTTVQTKILPTEQSSTSKPKQTQPEIKATTPLPSLDEFLRSQYGPPIPTTTKETVATSEIPTTPPTITTSQKPHATSTQKPKSPAATTTKKPITINVEDLPVAEVLDNGNPADDVLINKLPPHLQPKMNTGKVLRTENKYPTEVEYPEMKTAHREVASPSFKMPTTMYNTFYEQKRPVVYSPPLSPISAFLARFDLTKADILARSGEYTHTIVDDDGSLLEVRFILSSPIHRQVTKGIPFK